MSDERNLEQMIADAEIGKQGREFLASELGKVMVGLADNEVQLAQEALGEVDPENTAKIRELQNQIKVGKWFTRWLFELIDEGEQAISEFVQERDT